MLTNLLSISRDLSKQAGIESMALLNQNVQVTGQLGKLFEALRRGQAPDNFSRAFLKDLGFKSSNHHAFIPLLKGLGFLTSDGTPTQRYKDFLDETKWRQTLAHALREAYGDIFVLKSKPTASDRKMIAGKYKSTYNLSDTAADRSAGTFLSLLELADEATLYGDGAKAQTNAESRVQQADVALEHEQSVVLPISRKLPDELGLHYNIQIHLPATKDLEVYNAIFKSLREHLVA